MPLWLLTVRTGAASAGDSRLTHHHKPPYQGSVPRVGGKNCTAMFTKLDLLREYLLTDKYGQRIVLTTFRLKEMP